MKGIEIVNKDIFTKHVNILIFIFLHFLAENIIYNAAKCKHTGRFSAQTQKG